MLDRMRYVISILLVFAMASIGVNAQVQRRTYRSRDIQARDVVQRIESRTRLFHDSLNASLNSRRVDTTQAQNDINLSVRNFEDATTQLRLRLDRRQVTATDVQTLLNYATDIDNFMQRYRMGARAERDWVAVTADLTELGRLYGINWRRSTQINQTTDRSTYRQSNRLTGTFQLDTQRSDDPRLIAEREIGRTYGRNRQRQLDALTARLESPDKLAIERRGMTVTMASSRAPQFTFEADGRERNEQASGRRIVRTRATLAGDQLNVNYSGDRGNEFSVTFDPIENGQRLLVTRRVVDVNLSRPVVVQSYYNRISDLAQWDVYNGTQVDTTQTTSSSYIIPDGTIIIATLDDTLTTRQTRENDRFRMTVREPAQYAGAVIEGYVSQVKRSGSITGRSEMTLAFESIRLRDSSSPNRFSGLVEGIRTPSNDSVQTSNEGTVRSDSQTNRTATRTAIGAGIGAIIGAAIGGGKGAAIGAAIGAGGGAGSVFVQGRRDLELINGTEVTIRSSAPLR